MEIIKKAIKDDDIIRWEKNRVINYQLTIYISFIIAISLIWVILTLIGLFYWYVANWEDTLIILSILITGATIVGADAIFFIKRRLQRLDLKISDLRSYHLIHLLTNKRWIQKDFRSLINFEENKIPSEAFSRNKDIVSINLIYIEKVTIIKIRFRTNNRFLFHFKNTNNLTQYPTFIVYFKKKEYQEVKNVLNHIIPREILND